MSNKKKIIEEGWHEEDSGYFPVYYRLYVPKSDTKPVVVTMQDFDEMDYCQERFLNDVQYDTRLEAQMELNRIHNLLFGGW